MTHEWPDFDGELKPLNSPKLWECNCGKLDDYYYGPNYEYVRGRCVNSCVIGRYKRHTDARNQVDPVFASDPRP